jgi:hypothetical protein
MATFSKSLLYLFVWQIALIPTIVTVMAQAQTTQMAVRSSKESGDTVSEMKSLAQEVERHKGSIDRWNTARIVFTIIAALAATGLVVTGVMLNSKGKILSKAQDDLSILKDAIAAEDSRTKAVQIAEAQKAAAQADEHAKQLEKQTEELRSQNLELQRRINPRFLTSTERQTILDGIRPFRGHQIIIARLGDAEAGQYGDSIIALFEEAGWAVQRNNIGVYIPPTYGIICRISLHPDDAVRALIQSFHNAKIKIELQEVPAAPQNSWVDIMIGLKPIT